MTKSTDQSGKQLSKSRFSDLEWAFNFNHRQWEYWMQLYLTMVKQPHRREELRIEIDRDDVLSYIED